MPQTPAEKRDRFARMFPDRVEKAVKQFQLISNCSGSSNYDYDRDTVAKVWIHLLEAMRASADDYGLDIDFKINGKTLGDCIDSGSIRSLFETEQPEVESTGTLF
jgi:hypothetical protein